MIRDTQQISVPAVASRVENSDITLHATTRIRQPRHHRHKFTMSVDANKKTAACLS